MTKCPECGSKDLVCSIHVRADFLITSKRSGLKVTEYRVTSEPEGSYIVSCANPDCHWCDESGPEYEELIDVANEWSNWGNPEFSTTTPVPPR